MPILDPTAANLDQIRKAIDTSLTADDLPDAVIQLGIYLGRAESWVLARTTGTGSHAENAVIARTAALLLPKIPNIVKETRPGFSWERKAIDVPQAVNLLNSEAEAEIVLEGSLVPTSSLSDRPIMFTAVGPSSETC